MVLVDFSHLSMRNLYVAISHSKPKKFNGKYRTEDFLKFYYHLMFKSLRHISTKFKAYGEIVICIDAKRNWRKDVYEDYKGNRKKERDESDIDFTTFFEGVVTLKQALVDSFPYSVVEADNVEADDIIGVLAKKFASLEKVICVSSDKDMRQILEYGAELYDPIKLAFIKMTSAELKEWKIEHILCGDEGDNVPHILRGTQFTDTFLKYLKENSIYVKTPEEFNELSISTKLYSEFDIYKTNKKGEVLNEKDIFKATPFGPSGAKKFAENLAENLKASKVIAQNFARNKSLVLFSSIPEEIVEVITTAYDETNPHHDSNGILKFLSKHSLTEHLMNISDFEITARNTKEKKNSSLSEWA